MDSAIGISVQLTDLLAIVEYALLLSVLLTSAAGVSFLVWELRAKKEPWSLYFAYLNAPDCIKHELNT